MKPSFGTLLLLSGLTLMAPAVAMAATSGEAETASKSIAVVEPVRDSRPSEEAMTKKKVTETTKDQSSTSEQVDLSGIDWKALARLVYGKCGEYRDLAISVGWPVEQWPTLSMVMFRESRCNFDSFNPTDPNGGSRGLIQINGFWCRPNRYSPQGWLQGMGILNDCEDLFIPEINLRAGLAMWHYSQDHNGCGWRPWSTRCS